MTSKLLWLILKLVSIMLKNETTVEHEPASQATSISDFTDENNNKDRKKASNYEQKYLTKAILNPVKLNTKLNFTSGRVAKSIWRFLYHDYDTCPAREANQLFAWQEKEARAQLLEKRKSSAMLNTNHLDAKLEKIPYR